MKRLLPILFVATAALAAGGDTINFTTAVKTLADGDTFYATTHWGSMRDTIANVVNGRLGNINLSATAQIDAAKFDTTKTAKFDSAKIQTAVKAARVRADSGTIPILTGSVTTRGAATVDSLKSTKGINATGGTFSTNVTADSGYSAKAWSAPRIRGDSAFVSGGVAIGGALTNAGISWSSQTAAEANEWNAVTYGGGQFVAVAVSGTHQAMTSVDGVNWTARTCGTAGWNAVTYGGGQFVAVAGTGTNRVQTSSDGISWTDRSAAQNNTWRAVAYGVGSSGPVYVAVSSDGSSRVMTSPDGVTWTARTAAEANSWTGLCFGNGLFVAVAMTGTNRVMTSPDGVTWTARAAAEDNLWFGVTYGRGLFVAVGKSGTNRVMTSPDGVTWTARAAAEVLGYANIAFGGGQFVAVARDGACRAMTSVDGVSWTSRSVPEACEWYGLAYGAGAFVAVAVTGTNRVMLSGCVGQLDRTIGNYWQGGALMYGSVTVDSLKSTNGINATGGTFSAAVTVDSLKSTKGINATGGTFSTNVTADSGYSAKAWSAPRVRADSGTVPILTGSVTVRSKITADSIRLTSASSGTFTMTLYTNFVSEPSGTCYWEKYGSMVVLFVPEIAGTSNGGPSKMYSYNNIPSQIRPSADLDVSAIVIDTSEAVSGRIRIKTNGSIEPQRIDPTTGQFNIKYFATGGTKGISRQVLVYSLY